MSERLTWTKGDVSVETPRYDRAELAEKMATAIGLGVDADDSGLVHTREDRAMWRQLAGEIAALQREGIMPVYTVSDDDADDL